MSSYLAAIQSVIPKLWSPRAEPLPEVGAQAPSVPLGGVDLSSGIGKPALVAFVRHCGCPFAEKEVKILSEQARAHPEVQIFVVQHSREKETQEWFESLGGKSLFPDESQLKLIADPSRELYAAYGIGQLGWGGMINGSAMGAVKDLREKEGISLRPTGAGSYRWQNSGGFGISAEGQVRWRKLAENAADMCDYAQAAQAVLS